MMSEKIDGFVREVAPLFEQINELTRISLPHYRSFTRQVEHGIITDLKVIDWELSSMLSYCHDGEVLALYKRVLRCLVDKHYAFVEDYVILYREMWEDDYAYAWKDEDDE